MVVIIAAAGNGFYFVKAKVISIRLFERENHINKVFTQLYHIGKPCPCGKRDHGFGRMNCHLANKLKFVHQMVKKPDGNCAFSIQKIAQRFVIAGMCLVGIYKLPVT